MTHVVTASDAQEQFLDDALTSVRSQTYRGSDVLVVRWGPDHDSADIVTARNHGLAAATGRYVRLLEASDTLPWHSTAQLVRALASSHHGSAAGVSRRGASWRDRAFAPAPGVDPGLADRLLDVRRWREAGLSFELGHGRFGDVTVLAVDRQLGCARVDAVTHEDHDRQLGLPFSHLRRWADEFGEWLPAVEASLSAATADWAAAVLDTRLPAVLADVESLDDQQWQRLVAVTSQLWSRAGDQVRAESRVLAWLVAQGDRDRVTRLVLARWRADADFRTVVRDGNVYADFGVGEVPDDVRRLSTRETPLAVHVQSRSTEQVELVAFIRGVATTATTTVGVSRQGRGLNATSAPNPATNRVAGEAEHDHTNAWLTVERPDGGGDQVWRVEVTSQGITRDAPVVIPQGNEVAASLTDPRDDDQIGPYAQLHLQRWYAGTGPSGPGPIEPDLAYFQAYAGQQPTDSPLAIHQALRRMHPEVRTRWLVEDLSIPLPEGAEPVLLRSREWYRTLATARWLVTNIEMERWFRRRPGQELCQTFHGLPGKSMGLSSWQHLGLTPGRIEQARAHTVDAWTLLLTGDPGMTHHYREQFGYDGAVFEHGYPRDDVLVGPDAPAIRERTRVALGIDAGQTAVLYAPTWRDRLATNFRRARLHDGFDVAAAAAALGSAYVLLLRGHRFHRDLDVAGAARVLDVTAYPEVNDLILAADVAVLDYSSIRFDFGLTDRPMVFCVPDLEDYTEGRGFLYDYLESAPGPLVRSTDEVVGALHDLPALTSAYADERNAFRRRFLASQDGHSAEAVVAAFFGDDRVGSQSPGD